MRLLAPTATTRSRLPTAVPLSLLLLLASACCYGEASSSVDVEEQVAQAAQSVQVVEDVNTTTTAATTTTITTTAEESGPIFVIATNADDDTSEDDDDDDLNVPMKIGEVYRTHISLNDDDNIHINMDSSIPTVRARFNEADDNDNRVFYEVHHKDAPFLSVHFAMLKIFHPDCTVAVNDPNNEQDPTIFDFDDNTRDREWSHHVYGDTLRIILDCYESDDDVQLDPSEQIVFYVDKYVAGFIPDRNNNNNNRRLRNSAITTTNTERNLATCGASDLRDVKCYEETHYRVYQHSRPVARLIINGNSVCTGFLVGEHNLFLTNNHCISSQRDVDNTVFEFLVDDVCGGTAGHSVWGFRGHIWQDTNKERHQLIRTSASDDVSVIQLAGSPRHIFGYLHLERQYVANSRIYIPQHAGGRSKEVGLTDSNQGGRNCVVGHGFEYSCDTEGGTSGSPIMNFATNKVIGIHKGARGNCRNFGVPVDKWYNWVHPLVYPPRPTPAPTRRPTPPPPTRRPTRSPTKQPTRAPTPTPTISPTEDGLPDQTWIICNDPAACGGTMSARVAPISDDIHHVRCCADFVQTGNKNWILYDTACSVWTMKVPETDNIVCHEQAGTFRESMQICEAAGGRMCSLQEMAMGCTPQHTCTSGRISSPTVWTSTTV